MGKRTSHKVPKFRNISKQKICKFVLRATYLMVIAPLLSLTTSPAYSNEKITLAEQEIRTEAFRTVELVAAQKVNETSFEEKFVALPIDELELTRLDVVTIATSQIGTCGSPAIKKYTSGRTDQWCSEFVSWVYKEANISFSGGLRNTPWVLINSSEIENWFRANGRYHSVYSDYVPQKGDYVQTRNSDGSLHSAIIVDIVKDPKTNKTIFITVDGNWNNCVTLVDSHTKGNILGFGEIANL